MLTNKKKIAIIGASHKGQAGVVLDALSLTENHEIIYFFDNTKELKGKSIHGIKIVGDIYDISDTQISEIDFFHIAIGNNKARLDIFNFLKKKKCEFLTIMHPSSVVSLNSVVGEGCFIGSNAVILNGCTIGEVSIFNSSSVIEHDNIIGKGVHVAPNSTTGGRVQIDNLAFVGIGSTILPDVKIGESSFVGAGSMIRKDVPKNTTMVGYDAKVHKKNIYEVQE